jgi:hypothetical protein
VSRLRFLFGESGACGAHINNVVLPGGYIDAGCGWRRHDGLASNLDRYLGLLRSYEALCRQYPQIAAWMIFTQGFVAPWGDFQFNYEWNQL